MPAETTSTRLSRERMVGTAEAACARGNQRTERRIIILYRRCVSISAYVRPLPHACNKRVWTALQQQLQQKFVVEYYNRLQRVDSLQNILSKTRLKVHIGSCGTGLHNPDTRPQLHCHPSLVFFSWFRDLSRTGIILVNKLRSSAPHILPHAMDQGTSGTSAV